MKNPTIKIIVAVIMMIIAVINARMEISTTWHYFGNGALFGIGLSILFLQLYPKLKGK